MTTKLHNADDKHLQADATEEEWRSIPGYPNYEASSLGRIRRSAPGKGTYVGRIIQPRHDPDGYLRIILSHDGVAVNEAVAKLVMLAFVGERPGRFYEIHHIDAVRDNNRVSNLMYVTRLENMKHAYQRKLARIRAGHPARRPSKTGKSGTARQTTKGPKIPGSKPVLRHRRVRF